MSVPNITLIVPAFNEEADLPSLLTRIQHCMSRTDRYRVLVIDDGSSDRTAEIAREAASIMPVELIQHRDNQGLGAALRTGFQAAAVGEGVIVTMDADNSQDPALIRTMMERINEGIDVVIASRFLPESGELGVSALRRALSHLCSAALRVLVGYPQVRDYTSGFRVYRVEVIRRLIEVFGSSGFLRECGFACMLELLLRLQVLGATVREVPLVLRYDLKTGVSKMRILHTMWRYVVTLARQGNEWRRFRRAVRCVGTLLALFLGTMFFLLTAARAEDNPIIAADDAFGMTLGTESIGIYSPVLVRGFNPQAAGNVRVDGLYFDQQGSLSNRVIEGATIHVGMSNTGYIFPAPTGIVDYTLRGGHSASDAVLTLYEGPYESTAANLDVNWSLLNQQVVIPMGVGAGVEATAPGYTSKGYSLGAVPKFTPNERITIRALIDWQRSSQQRNEPFIFPSGDFIPPQIGGGYWGQDWTQTRTEILNYGAMLAAELSQHWSVLVGVFRSISDSPVSFSDLYVNAERSGAADHVVVGYPNQRAASTSGEVRVVRHISAGAWYYDVILSARGRDVRDVYGGSDLVDLGTIALGDSRQFPKPDFHYTGRTMEHGDLSTLGLIYRARLPGKAEWSVGVQQYDYRKSDMLPEAPEYQLRESTWRGYGSATYSLTDQLAVYAGYTQGLEDSGVAPGSAQNRGAVLQATETWQIDADLRWLMGTRLKWMLGAFQINEPYFTIDNSNIDRELGVQRARGGEFSVAGKVSSSLSIVVGAMITQVKVIGPDLNAAGISSVAFGQSHNQIVLNADYSPVSLPSLSLDFGINRTGVTPASQDGLVRIPPFNMINAGGRYRFHAFNIPFSLRVEVSNLTNVYIWNVGNNPGFYRLPPRGLLAYLTAEL